ncbi:MAG: class I SAM-dependent methyltransferase [Acidobacteriaceae bacterium]
MGLTASDRFTSRVDDYRRYRPRYPAAIVDQLRRDCDLSVDTKIVDIAAGTGLLAEIFLAHGNRVVAVEPNTRMRGACATLEEIYPGLQCMDGTAEATGLAEHSVDMVTVGQAMHWFDLQKTRAEFARILRPHGWCVVAYNHRRRSGDGLHDGYEAILNEFGTDYRKVQSAHLTEDRLRKFFSPSPMCRRSLGNAQVLDLEGLQGRVLSSSYMPGKGHPRYPRLQQEIAALFAQNQKEGLVRLEYDCVISYGQLG